MLAPFQPVAPVADTTLQRVQQAIQRALRRVTACPLLDGNLLTVTLVASATTPVLHKLGRPALGFLVAGLTAPARLTRIVGPLESQILQVQADAATTATLWVF